MKTRLYRLLSILMVLVLALIFSACGQEKITSNNTSTPEATIQATTESSKTSEPEKVGYQKPAKDVTLQIFSMATNSSGIQNDPLAKYMQDKFGIIVDWLPAAGDTAVQKLQAMMAAGELPDLVCFHDVTQASDAINAKLLMPLDENMDKLPNLAKNADKSLAYFRDTIGNGKTYVVGQGINTAIFEGLANWQINLRWDLYKKIGMPAINTMYDLIPILKEMQKLEPKNSSGKKVYGVSLWPDWDGNSLFITSEFTSFYGVETWAGYAEYNAVTDTVGNQLADDSWYKKGIKFFYDLNKAGLLDPDSLTQRFDNGRSKYQDGRALMAFHSWVSGGFNGVEGNDEKLVGFVPFYPKDMKVLLDQSSPIGVYPWSIGNPKEKKEQALKFLDFWFSIDSSSIINNGFEGEDWVMKDGVPTVTEKGLADLDSGVHAKNYAFYSHPGLFGGFYNEATKLPLSRNYWPQIEDRAPVLKLTQDWRKTLNIKTPFDGMDKTNNTAIRIAYGLIPPLSEDINAMLGKIAPIVKEAGWKMVFAKNEAEFEKLWKDMQTKAEGLGLQQVYEAGVKAFEQTRQNTEKYGDKTIIGINK